jgi:ketopantoate reductase
MMDVVVIGAGAVGMGLAVEAAVAGRDVACVGRSGPKQHGDYVGPRDHCTATFAAPDRAALAILAVKAQDQASAVEQHRAILERCDHVAVVRNGMNPVPTIGKACAHVITWSCAERVAGTVRWRTPTRLAVVEGPVGWALAQLFGPSEWVTVDLVDAARHRALSFEKLMVNASLNPMCALHRLPPGTLMRDSDRAARVLAVAREVESLARAEGLVVRAAEQIVGPAAESMGDFPPSMLQDVERGHATEFEQLVAWPLRELSRRQRPHAALTELAEQWSAREANP